MLCLDILFNSSCYHLFEEESWDILALLIPSSVWPSIHSIQSIKTTAYLAPTWTLQKSGLIPGPKICLSLFPTKPPKNQIKSLHLIPSLKLICIPVMSSPFDYLLLRFTLREPSHVLIGLAMRLSVVWCGPRTLSFQPEENIGSKNTHHCYQSLEI